MRQKPSLSKHILLSLSGEVLKVFTSNVREHCEIEKQLRQRLEHYILMAILHEFSVIALSTQFLSPAAVNLKRNLPDAAEFSFSSAILLKVNPVRTSNKKNTQLINYHNKGLTTPQTLSRFSKPVFHSSQFFPVILMNIKRLFSEY